MHSSFSGSLLYRPKYALLALEQSGHRSSRCSTVSFMCRRHCGQIGTYSSAVLKVFTSGLQLASNWLMTTSALLGVMFKGLSSSDWAIKTNLAGFLDLADALTTLKRVLALQCSVNGICMACFASLSAISFS